MTDTTNPSHQHDDSSPPSKTRTYRSQINAAAENLTLPSDDIDSSIAAGATPLWSDTVDLPTDQLQIPYLTLAQSNSPAVQNDEAKMGQWLLQGWPAESEVVIVPLKFGISRRYAELQPDERWLTLCESPLGHEHGIGDPGIPCGECALKDWSPGDKTDERGRVKNRPPLCKESYEFLSWSETHGTLCRVAFRSTGLKAGRQLAMLGRTRGLGQFPVRLASVRQTGRYVYATPSITLIPPSEWGSILESAQGMLALDTGDR